MSRRRSRKRFRRRSTPSNLMEQEGTIEESDLPKNKKSSKKYKIVIDESAETVEKTKTTINNIVRYYHDKAMHPDEAHPERLQGQDVQLSGIRQSERCKFWKITQSHQS